MYTVTSGVTFLVELLRHRISDPKYVYSTVVNEDAGISVGSPNEVFYTENMPVASGFDANLRVGRWHYGIANNSSDAQGVRKFVLVIESGGFLIPTGAISQLAGERVKLSYTWLEEQPNKFSDSELKIYLADAIKKVNDVYYDFGFTISVSGNVDLSISPTIKASDLASHVYAMYASYIVKGELEAEGFGDRIYVRDINITIDTSKGLGDLQKSSQNLLKDFLNIINELRINGQESAFARIDTYSTVKDITGMSYNSSFNSDEQIMG